eukprot:7811381-Pyramimonas_sp.AAC.1
MSGSSGKPWPQGARAKTVFTIAVFTTAYGWVLRQAILDPEGSQCIPTGSKRSRRIPIDS